MTKKYIAIKYTKSSPNKILANRLQVKAFADANARGAFLCKQTNNDWKEVGPEAAGDLPTKSGYYRFAGGKWHNEKGLDACFLAHA